MDKLVDRSTLKTHALGALLALGLLTACSGESQEASLVAQAQNLVGMEKTELLIDAAASSAGSYPISSYVLSNLDDQASEQSVIRASQAQFRLRLPAVAKSTTLNYSITVIDTAGNQATAPVRIAVEAIDEAPLATADALTAIAGTRFSSAAGESLLKNDFDEPDLSLGSQALRAHLVRAPTVVTNFSLAADGSLRFDVPQANAANSDSFSYRVSDDSGLFSDEVEVYLRLAVSGQALVKPDARAASIIASENSSALIDASGSVPGSFPIISYQLLATQVPSSWVGTLPSGATSSSPRFSIRAGNLKQDSTLTFKLIVRDSQGNRDEQLLQATFRALDTKPTATADRISAQAGELLKVSDLRFSGSTLSSAPAGNLLLNDRDEPDHTAASNQLRVELLTLPRHSSGFYVNALGGFAYRAPASAGGSSDSFSYRVKDASGVSAATIVTLEIKAASGVAPTARASAATVNEKSTITVDASASTAGSSPIVSYRLSHGSLPTGWSIPSTDSSSARISFSAGPVFTRTTIPLTVWVRDSSGRQSSVALSLTVLPVEEAPRATGEQYSLSRGHSIRAGDLAFSGSILSLKSNNNLLLNDRDEPEQTAPSTRLRAVLVRAPAQTAGFYLNPLGGWQYSASATATLSADSFSYRVSDGSLSSAEVQVRIAINTASNASPSAANQCLALRSPGNSYVGQLAPLVRDDDDTSFNYSLVSAPTRGSVSVDLSTGRYSYTPNTSARGYADHLVYKVDDLRGGSATGIVSFVYGATRIMPLGDSITFGVESYTANTGDLPVVNKALGYRKHLYDKLVSAGYMVDFVGPRRAGWDSGLSDAEHAGFPGWRAEELAYGRSGDSDAGSVLSWLDANAPDAVLIHAGTNDHSSNSGIMTPLLGKIQQWQSGHHSVEIFVASIIDQRRDGGNLRQHLDAFNAGVEALAGSYSNANYVDQYSALNWQTDLSSYAVDSVGLHPNSGGYQKMANRWYEAVIQSGLMNKCP